MWNSMVALFLLAALFPAQTTEPAAFPVLTREFEPLRAEFNRDAGKVRLLLLLDPT